MFNNGKKMHKIIIESDKAWKSLLATTQKQARATVNHINDASEEEDPNHDMVNVMDVT